MSNYKYSTQNYSKENMARAIGVSLPISTKESIEICSTLRKMELQKAKALLKDVIEIKRAIPYRKFNHHVAHKKGIGPGRYPVKASSEILKLLESIESNAQFKGLSTGNLVIKHICAQRASRPLHSGRHGGRKMKRTHVEVIVEESTVDKSKAKKTKIKTETAIKVERKKPEVKK